MAPDATIARVAATARHRRDAASTAYGEAVSSVRRHRCVGRVDQRAIPAPRHLRNGAPTAFAATARHCRDDAPTKQLLSVAFVASDDETVRQSIAFRYNSVKSRLALMQART